MADDPLHSAIDGHHSTDKPKAVRRGRGSRNFTPYPTAVTDGKFIGIIWGGTRDSRMEWESTIEIVSYPNVHNSCKGKASGSMN